MPAQSFQLKNAPAFAAGQPSLGWFGGRALSIENNALADDGVIEVLIQGAANKATVLRASIDVQKPSEVLASLSAGSVGRLDLYEGPTINAAGTSETPVALDRRTPTQPPLGATVTSAPTLGGDGTLVVTHHREIAAVLAGGTNYVVRLRNLSDATVKALLTVELADA